MSDKELEQPVQYLLGQPQRRTGVGPFSMKATIVIAVGFLIFLLTQIAGQTLFAFLVVLPMTIFVVVLVSVRWGNRSLAQAAQILWQNRRRVANNSHIYVSGPNSRIPGGHRRLPGLFARTEAIEAVYSPNRPPFVMILDRPRREVTVLLDCQMTGQTAMTQAERNLRTAEWCNWLAKFSLSGDIAQVVTVVATRPGTGELVNNEVRAIIADDAPAIAKRIVTEAASVIALARPEVMAHIAITIKLDKSQLTDESYIRNIATRIGTWADTVQYAGILAEPMTYEQAVARIHMFYNPPTEADFEEIALTGEGHGMLWQDAGPNWAVTTNNYYEHCGAKSVTWEMKDAPRSTFEDTILSSLMQPHDRIQRKRVALVYRPFSAGQGAIRVEAEHRDAMVAANSSRSITSAKAEMRLETTEAARRAQARGAQLGRTSMFVTATVTPEEDFNRVIHDIEQLAAGSSITLQRMKRQQDAGFQASLGFGQVPWAKSTTSRLTEA
ncbi:hypothetical protein C1Y63_06210 [Corynebacterium sp. 13CS0277]|uniref:SCO6880 family protein n=1 Tax=Corynebacterium sp. 13CS0277 TaxID=2071994 RepID=UPI000D03A928|nr:SCO6880 family protein [Corynebacterium sp. 13CS0277]PRQ11440.1 hypothetical protein C1Y63_06210 [Corynebacterium sp. 13CS0277]